MKSAIAKSIPICNSSPLLGFCWKPWINNLAQFFLIFHPPRAPHYLIILRVGNLYKHKSTAFNAILDLQFSSTCAIFTNCQLVNRINRFSSCLPGIRGGNDLLRLTSFLLAGGKKGKSYFPPLMEACSQKTSSDQVAFRTFILNFPSTHGTKININTLEWRI